MFSKKKKKKKSNNPYASRGLDKFSSVLSDLREKKKKIISGNRGGVAAVRFAPSGSSEWIPVVVRRRTGGPGEEKRDGEERRPSLYLPLLLLLVLLCFLVSGKAFAIFCVSLCWYLLPPLLNRKNV